VIDTSEVRTRAIERKLRNVQELPQEKTNLILDTNSDTDLTEEFEAL
jgi:DNA recombination protein RmuC